MSGWASYRTLTMLSSLAYSTPERSAHEEKRLDTDRYSCGDKRSGRTCHRGAYGDGSSRVRRVRDSHGPDGRGRGRLVSVCHHTAVANAARGARHRVVAVCPNRPEFNHFW